MIATTSTRMTRIIAAVMWSLDLRHIHFRNVHCRRARRSDAIRFADELDGQTITLTQGQLPVGQSVDIDGPGADDLTVSGNAAGRVFDVAAGTTVMFPSVPVSAAPLSVAVIDWTPAVFRVALKVRTPASFAVN